ncbi:hypothetical protein [Pseudomonas sp. Ga0074129]|uniref:hypothetical protein n=1 Tax=Pseudomonas sp. Ga0074129 TaxID=1752219 RepID=UPI000A9A4419|nr:hypothetical protein [Pseudomonas sp. Ga0074129]
MAKKIRTYVVADGCIQEGSEVFVKGELYTPPTAALEKELLEAGLIALPAEQEAAGLAQAEADAKAQAEVAAKAQAEADAKAQAEADAKAQAEADAKAQADLLNQGQ